MSDSDEPWDEDRWEQAFRENDLRTDEVMRLHETFRAEHPAPSGDAPDAERAAWRRALERFLARHMGWDDLGDAIDQQPDELEPVADATVADDAIDFEDSDPKSDPLYQTVDRLTAPVVRWHRTLSPTELEDPDVQAFWIQSLTVGAKVAGASAYTAPHALGGRVAALKRALGAANAAVDALAALRGRPYLPSATHDHLAELAHDAREAVALAVLDARARFEGE